MSIQELKPVWESEPDDCGWSASLDIGAEDGKASICVYNEYSMEGAEVSDWQLSTLRDAIDKLLKLRTKK